MDFKGGNWASTVLRSLEILNVGGGDGPDRGAFADLFTQEWQSFDSLQTALPLVAALE